MSRKLVFFHLLLSFFFSVSCIGFIYHVVGRLRFTKKNRKTTVLAFTKTKVLLSLAQISDPYLLHDVDEF